MNFIELQFSLDLSLEEGARIYDASIFLTFAAAVADITSAIWLSDSYSADETVPEDKIWTTSYGMLTNDVVLTDEGKLKIYD